MSACYKTAALTRGLGVAIARWDLDAYQTSRAVNFDGPVRLAVLLVPHMVPGGTIVQVSSGTSRLE